MHEHVCVCVCVCVHVWPNQSRLFACLLPWRGCVFVVEMRRCREWTVTRAIRGRRPLIRTELLLYFTYRAHTHTEADGHTPVQIAGISLLASRGFLATCARACLGALSNCMCSFVCVCVCVCVCLSLHTWVSVYFYSSAYVHICECAFVLSGLLQVLSGLEIVVCLQLKDRSWGFGD